MLRFEYDAVVAYHPYRTGQPWDLGGTKILQVDGVNCGPEEREVIRKELHALEVSLCDEINRADGRAHIDNHYGFTVRIDGDLPSHEDAGYYQLRFSDGSLYIWLMPGPPR